MTLRAVLHAHVPTLTRESTVRDAVDKMDVYQFPALVMVDDDNGPIALITEGDICRGIREADALSALGDSPVERFCTPSPTVAHPDIEIGDALHLMLSSGLTLLPVVEDARLRGVVLRVDLMQAVLLDAAELSTP